MSSNIIYLTNFKDCFRIMEHFILLNLPDTNDILQDF